MVITEDVFAFFWKFFALGIFSAWIYSVLLSAAVPLAGLWLLHNEGWNLSWNFPYSSQNLFTELF